MINSDQSLFLVLFLRPIIEGYLRTLDILDLLDRAPVDAEHPYVLINNYIQAEGLKYETLLTIADHYYNKNTILQLAHTASAGGRP